MVTVSRFTQASTVPIFVQIATDRIDTSFTLIGPFSNLDVPGHRVRFLAISDPESYAVTIVCGNNEYNWREVGFDGLDRIDAITISDGFIYAPPFALGYTFRPEIAYNGRLGESGKSFIYSGYPAPYPPYGPYSYGEPGIEPYPYGEEGEEFIP